jgi:PHP domain-containing protein
LHSDGQDTIATMFAACKRAGYAAVALTDHNTVSGLQEATRIAEELDLVLVPGVEVTTFHGHAIVLGVSRVPEWRDLEARGMDALASDVHAAGGVVCIAHPAHLGSPVCSGCGWEWPIEPNAIDSMEILTAARMYAEVPLELWRQQLCRGAKLAPSGAGDVHNESAAASARAATYVYVRERTPEAVLEALRAGRVFSSEEVRLDFWLEHTANGRTALVGEEVARGDWEPRTEPAAEVCRLDLNDGRRCLYATVRDAEGRLQALSAPIWIDTSH